MKTYDDVACAPGCVGGSRRHGERVTALGYWLLVWEVAHFGRETRMSMIVASAWSRPAAQREGQRRILDWMRTRHRWEPAA